MSWSRPVVETFFHECVSPGDKEIMSQTYSVHNAPVVPLKAKD